MRLNLARLLASALFLATAAGAQEAPSAEATNSGEIDALEPAVDTTAAAERDTEQFEPGVPSAVLAQDIRRTENASGVMDEIDLGRTEITGNQELPKVLYIVPWQKSDPGALMGRPVNTLIDEVLAPIDRSEFIRQVDYYGDLYDEEEE